jgi:AcrR family transcriptional regulator
MLKQLVLDRVTEKVHAKADQLQQKAAEVHEKANHLAGPAELYDALAVWTRRPPGSRQPRFTHDDIAAAAIRIADDEGIAALSMRRLAVELEAGTMTLYHYVRTKDELLALVSDAVMGEVVVPGEALDADWRSAIVAIAHSSKAALERHPWMFDIVEDPDIGPNGVKHFDQALRAVASMPGTLADKLDVIFSVDEYVFGHCLHARGDQAHLEDVHDESMMRYVEDLVRTGDYPTLDALIEEHGTESLWNAITAHSHDPGRFDRNLHRLLDGIERTL